MRNNIVENALLISEVADKAKATGILINRPLESFKSLWEVADPNVPLDIKKIIKESGENINSADINL